MSFPGKKGGSRGKLGTKPSCPSMKRFSRPRFHEGLLFSWSRRMGQGIKMGPAGFEKKEGGTGGFPDIFLSSSVRYSSQQAAGLKDKGGRKRPTTTAASDTDRSGGERKGANRRDTNQIYQ